MPQKWPWKWPLRWFIPTTKHTHTHTHTHTHKKTNRSLFIHAPFVTCWMGIAMWRLRAIYWAHRVLCWADPVGFNQVFQFKWWANLGEESRILEAIHHTLGVTEREAVEKPGSTCLNTWIIDNLREHFRCISRKYPTCHQKWRKNKKKR